MESDLTLCRAVIITALSVEYSAVSSHLAERKERTHPQGTIYEVGTFSPTSGRHWEVVLVEIGAGNPTAAAEVERAIAYWQPNTVLFVGVAGGLKDVSIGDVVASTKVYGYESGKDSEEFKTRPAVHQSTYRLIQRAKAEARSGVWRERIIGDASDPLPRVLVGPIAAGEKVVADSQSPTSTLIKTAYGDALAVEMEGYGFLHGAFINEHTPALVVRGISDLLDGKTSADQTGSQELASRHASAFCFELLAKLDVCPGHNSQSMSEEALAAPSFALFESKLAEHEMRVQSIEKVLGLKVISDTTINMVGDDHFTTEMNAARDLLNKGHAHAAGLLLDSLASQVGKEGFSKALHFRLETNLGGRALMLEKYEEAEKHLAAALELEPNDPKALANRAQAAIIRDQSVSGLSFAQKAYTLAPNDPHVVSVYLRALDANGEKQAIADLVSENPWLLEKAESTFILALFAYDAGHFEKAEALARRSVVLDPGDPQAIEALARYIVTPIESDLERDPPLPGKLPDDILSRATEAEQLYSQAIQILENQDYKHLLLVTLANRGMVRGLLGRYDDALQDYDRVLGQDPKQQIVKLNKGRLLLGLGRPLEAIQVFEGLQDAHERAWRPIAAAYLATDQPQKALNLLLPLWAKSLKELDRIRVGDLLLHAYSDLGQIENAEAIATSLEKDFADSAEAAAIAAEWLGSRSDHAERALALLYEALAKATNDRERDRINVALANFYYTHERFAEAADLYRNLAATSNYPAINKRYLLSLFYGGLHREALTVAQKLRAGGRAIPLISAIEVTLLELVGDTEESKRLLHELIDLEPDDPDHRITLAYLCYRTGDIETAKAAVLGTTPEEVKGRANQLMALAKVRSWLDLDGVLQLAYRARRLGFDDASIHQDYISLVLHRKREEDSALQISKVQVGSTVHLEANDGSSRIFTIVEGLDADLQRGELLPSDPVALKLLGLVVGDSITLKQSEIETVSLQVIKVESQYVFAFQDTLLNFSTWFPDVQDGPEKLQADDAGIDKMLRMIDRRQSHSEMVLNLYRDQRITLGMLAKLSGVSLLRAWSAVQGDDKLRLMAALGNAEELHSEQASLLSAEVLVLELTGFLTIMALNLLPVLKKRFQVIAPQFVWDQINEELTLERAGLRSGMQMGGSLYREGERYVLQEAPKTTSDRRVRFLEELLQSLKEHVDLKPIPAILDFPQDGIKNVLGRTALASVLVAKESGGILYSDDLVLRLVARNTWGVLGAWSQNVMRELARTSHLSLDEYHRGVAELAQRNYQFVGLDESDLMWVLRNEGMQVTPRFTRTLRVLEGPSCTEDSAVIAASAFIKEIAFNVDSQQTRQLLLDGCISVVKQGRNTYVSLSKFGARVQRLLAIHPEACAEVLQTVNLWKSEKTLLEQAFPVRKDQRKRNGGGR